MARTSPLGVICYAPRHTPRRISLGGAAEKKPPSLFGPAIPFSPDKASVKGALVLPEGWAEKRDEEGRTYFANVSLGYASYDDPRTTDTPEKSAVLKCDGVWTIAEIKENGYRGLASNKLNWDTAQIPLQARNTTVNRYVDILPNPRTRVRLESSEYINANYIAGPRNDEHAFIASMGPKLATSSQHWQMVWDTNVNTIIMVTGLVEKGRDKCGPYFPLTDVGPQSVVQFGGITIANKAITDFGSYRLSKFVVTRGKERREVNHWWFTAWPDHGVPTNADGSFDVDSLLDMLEHVKKGQTAAEAQASQLVHCSAGVGRTGVTIGVQHAMQELQDNLYTDPLDTIFGMRQDRCLLVQHVEQYAYLHRAIVRYCERKGKAFKVKGTTSDDSMDAMLALQLRQSEHLAAAMKLENAWV